MLLTLLIGACAVTSAVAQAQTYTANFSTSSYDCGTADCPVIGYPYYDALYYSNIQDIEQRNSTVGFYRGCFEVWQMANSLQLLTGPVTSKSDKNTESRSVLTLASTTVQSPMANLGAISANYDKSRVKKFDFKSFWAGCTAKTAPSPSGSDFMPVPCNITIKGYTGTTPPVDNAKPAAQQTFVYNPQIQYTAQGYPVAQMSQYTASAAFKNVRTVTFGAVFNSTGYQNPPSIFLDDLVYTVYR